MEPDPPELHDRARELTRDPGYAELLAAIRARLEAHADAATVTLADLGPAARRALADLLGHRRVPDGTLRISCADLDARFRSSRLEAGLLEVLEAAGGPLADHRARRHEARLAWEAVLDGLDAEPAVLARPELAAWAAGLREDGLLRRLTTSPEDAHALVRRALPVAAALPAGEIALSVLAARHTGDPHALDHGTPLATLVLRAALLLAEGQDLPTTPAGRRRLWSQVGVVCDPLSSDVLVLGLRSRGDGLLAGTLAAHATEGEPIRITLRALRRHPLVPAGTVLHVCENPAVVAAAAEVLGAGCSPLLCVEGMPGVAADRVLFAARDAGVAVRFHADFDWGGLRIGNLLASRYGATPWRFDAAAYEEALAATPHAVALRGRPILPSWDPRLGDAMSAGGRAVSEEQVLESLLAGLAAQA